MNHFEEDYISTVGANFGNKSITYQEINIKL